MTKIIRIETCRECPHKKISRLQSDDWLKNESWLCEKSQGKLIFTWSEIKTFGTSEIPVWCPLSDETK